MATNASAKCDRRGWLVHAGRVLMIVSIALLLRSQHRSMLSREASRGLTAPPLERVRRLLPEAATLHASDSDPTTWDVADAAGKSLGWVLQTSPASDSIVGFSGSSNLLVAFDSRGRIAGLDILASRDTQEHVDLVLRDPKFLKSLNGQNADEAASQTKIDAVSGATLTSLAMIEGVQRRLGGRPASLKFPEIIEVKHVTPLFAEAVEVEKDAGDAQVIRVFDKRRESLGWMLRTSPTADNIVGYQGPTDALIGFNRQGKIFGVVLGKSFDNDPYVRYVREDEPFLALFNDKTAEQLAGLDLKSAGVEGVSGATMTSMAVAEGLVRAAEAKRAREDTPPPRHWWETIAFADIGSGFVIVLGVIVGLTRLRGIGWLRIVFQLVAFGYLGLVNVVLLSQAQWIGWAQAGVPRGAWSLLALTVAAILVPIATKRNIYCTHLCPHGALQQLVLRTMRPRRTLPPRFRSLLVGLPVVLLVACLVIAMTGTPLSLVNLEPFDAYGFRIAGVATLTIAIIGVVASFFVPMAYCRYGCPTGALIEYVRRTARDGELLARDGVAAACVLLAAILWWWN